jgi:hypothetical protein
MVSLDIVNLFTNISIDYTLNLIKDKLNECEMLRDITNLSINEILLLLRFCMKKTLSSTIKFITRFLVLPWEVAYLQS